MPPSFAHSSRRARPSCVNLTQGRCLAGGSEYLARWGYDYALYRPLLGLVRLLNLPALALNAPVELTERVGDVGLDGLSLAERASLPDLDLEDPDYRGYVYELLGASHGAAFSGGIQRAGRLGRDHG